MNNNNTTFFLLSDVSNVVHEWLDVELRRQAEVFLKLNIIY